MALGTCVRVYVWDISSSCSLNYGGPKGRAIFKRLICSLLPVPIRAGDLHLSLSLVWEHISWLIQLSPCSLLPALCLLFVLPQPRQGLRTPCCTQGVSDTQPAWSLLLVNGRTLTVSPWLPGQLQLQWGCGPLTSYVDHLIWAVWELNAILLEAPWLSFFLYFYLFIWLPRVLVAAGGLLRCGSRVLSCGSPAP